MSAGEKLTQSSFFAEVELPEDIKTWQETLPQAELLSRYASKYSAANRYLGIETRPDETGGLQLSPPDVHRVVRQIGRGVTNFFAEHPDGQKQDRTIVLGFSGDLDSAFLLAALAQTKQEGDLPWEIQAFHVKTHYQPRRSHRIAEYLRYINQGFDPKTPTVNFTTFDFDAVANLARLALSQRYSSHPQPQDPLFMHQAVAQVISTQDRNQSLPDALIDTAKECPYSSEFEMQGVDLSNMMHDLIGVARGEIARHGRYSPVVISPQEATEVLLHNFPHQDIGKVGPMLHLSKNTVAQSFTQMIQQSDGLLKPRTWGYSLQTIVPLHIANAWLENGTVYRQPGLIPQHTAVALNPETSSLPPEE